MYRALWLGLRFVICCTLGSCSLWYCAQSQLDDIAVNQAAWSRLLEQKAAKEAAELRLHRIEILALNHLILEQVGPSLSAYYQLSASDLQALTNVAGDSGLPLTEICTALERAYAEGGVGSTLRKEQRHFAELWSAHEPLASYINLLSLEAVQRNQSRPELRHAMNCIREHGSRQAPYLNLNDAGQSLRDKAHQKVLEMAITAATYSRSVYDADCCGWRAELAYVLLAPCGKHKYSIGFATRQLVEARAARIARGEAPYIRTLSFYMKVNEA